MKLKLEKDLVVFDCETTGLSVSKDRIIQLAIIKYFADGRAPLERTRYINPGIPIPAVVTDLTGITNEMVKDQPTFSKLAKGLMELIGDADFLTFNGIRFDTPLLMEEFERCGMQLDMSERRCIDAQRIFHMMEPRTLKAAVKFYCNEKFENAHNAMSDVRATIKVLEAQLEKYEDKDFEDKNGNIINTPINGDVQLLHNFINDPNELDFQGKVKLNEEGIPCFTFGKFQNKPVGSSLASDSKYLQWILSGDFTADTKRVVTRLYNEFVEQNNNIAR
jgi:DNA polymerase-3 subunit epsilon